jgi:hypothetical protein
MGGVGDGGLCPVESAAGCNISFDADYWLDMCCQCFRVELDDSEQIAVVSDGNRVHAEFLTLFKQLIEDYRAIEQ